MIFAFGKPPAAAAVSSRNASAPSNDVSENVPPAVGAIVTGPARVGASSKAYMVPLSTHPPNVQIPVLLITWKCVDVNVKPSDTALVRIGLPGASTTSSKVMVVAFADAASNNPATAITPTLRIAFSFVE